MSSASCFIPRTAAEVRPAELRGTRDAAAGHRVRPGRRAGTGPSSVLLHQSDGGGRCGLGAVRQRGRGVRDDGAGLRPVRVRRVGLHRRRPGRPAAAGAPGPGLRPCPARARSGSCSSAPPWAATGPCGPSRPAPTSTPGPTSSGPVGLRRRQPGPARREHRRAGAGGLRRGHATGPRRPHWPRRSRDASGATWVPARGRARLRAPHRPRRRRAAGRSAGRSTWPAAERWALGARCED